MEKSTSKRGSFTPVILSLGFSAAVIGTGLIATDAFSTKVLASRLIKPLLRLLFFIGIGLAAGQVIEYCGWTRKMAFLARPLFRIGRLSDRCSAAFTTAFFSGVAANAMLLEMYKEKRITRQELFLTNFINQVPAYFLHLPTTVFIVIPLTGMAGLLYFALTFAALVIRTACFVIYGRMALPEKTEAYGPNLPEPKKQKFGDAIRMLKKKLPGRLTRIMVWVVPVYITVFVANAAGLFEIMQREIAGLLTTPVIPPDALSLVMLGFFAEFTSGFAAAGALLKEGILTTSQGVIALLIGNIVAFPIRAIRHQLPRYIGIFSPKMGTQLLMMGQGFRILSLILVGMIYYHVWV